MAHESNGVRTFESEEEYQEHMKSHKYKGNIYKTPFGSVSITSGGGRLSDREVNEIISHQNRLIERKSAVVNRLQNKLLQRQVTKALMNQPTAPELSQ